MQLALSSRFGVARPLFALAIIATLAACGGDGTTAPKDVSGSYALTTINGHGLPFVVPNSPGVTINSAIADLGADQSYSVLFSGIQGGTPSDIADNGTYVLSGSTVTFASIPYSASFTGTATSNSISFVVPGAFAGSTDPSFLLVFTRRRVD
jgi:hypothetical protein